MILLLHIIDVTFREFKAFTSSISIYDPIYIRLSSVIRIPMRKSKFFITFFNLKASESKFGKYLVKS